MDPGRRRALLSCLGLAVAVLAVYQGVASHAFVDLDTRAYLTENPRVLRGLSWSGVRWAFTTFHAANWHPLTWLSHMLDVELFGLRPAGHHLENVLLHAANACLVFLLFRSLTGADGRSLTVAAFFALHPLHVESVAWIVERKDLLAALFGLSSLLAWTAWTRRGGAALYLAALASFAAGLLCKPTIVTWPFVLLLLDAWPLERARLGTRRLLAEKLPWFALSIAGSVVTLLAQSAGGAVRSLESLPIGSRLANAILAYGAYLAKTFWPADLSYHYAHAAAGASSGRIVLAGLLLAIVTVLAVRSARRAPWLAFGWFFFLGTLVPVIGIVQVGWQGLADRYTYLPSIGVFVAAIWTAGAWIESRPALRPLAPEVAGAVALALGVCARIQTGYWKDTETLCAHAIDVDPRNFAAHDLLGVTYLDRGDLARAEAEFRAAKDIEPSDFVARESLGRTLERAGEHEAAETEFRELAARAPDRAEPRLDVARSLAARGRSVEALAEVDAALRIDPSLAPAHLERGRILESLARLDDARAAYGNALVAMPAYTEARLALARLEARRGDTAGAEAEIRRAIEADPEEPEARRGLALVLLAQGRIPEALAAARAALECRPGWALAMGDVAWILATSDDPAIRDPRTAVALAEDAARLSQEKHAGILDTLAAAYAASGRWQDAVASGEKALALAREAPDRAFADRVARRVSAYREGRMERGTGR